MRLLSALLLSAGLISFGCSSPTTPPTATEATAKSKDDHEHGDHDREHMMVAHAGPLHAWLTAHLSKDGNELDVIFETEDEPVKPAPIPVAKFTARAKRVADEKEFELTFEPAPADERKGDPPGAYSRYVAKAPWMTAEDVLTVYGQVEIDGKLRRPTWRTFIVKKYAHHAD
ncbi:MAG TPA: hypothetical protein VM533_00135 [Fimbriiglobus sp.]|jgi:hypothetical protein|nr:hypothetical protein [Fimbriiglobus sp.]